MNDGLSTIYDEHVPSGLRYRESNGAVFATTDHYHLFFCSDTACPFSRRGMMVCTR